MSACTERIIAAMPARFFSCGASPQAGMRSRTFSKTRREGFHTSEYIAACRREQTEVFNMKQRAQYGIDAPGVVRAHIVLGCALAVIASVGFAWPQPNPVPTSVSIGAACIAALLLVGAVMLASSLVGKKRVRDRLVTALALSGNERVLDAGCGRGLALIACAKKLTTGETVGIDLW